MMRRGAVRLLANFPPGRGRHGIAAGQPGARHSGNDAYGRSATGRGGIAGYAHRAQDIECRIGNPVPDPILVEIEHIQSGARHAERSLGADLWMAAFRNIDQ